MIANLKKETSKQANKPDPKEDVYNPSLRLFGDVRSKEIIARRNMQWFAYACLAIAGFSMFIAFSAAQRPAYVPYVVYLDKTGLTTTMGVPERLDIKNTSTTTAIQYQLRQFIQAARGVVYDPGYETKLINDYVKPFVQPATPASTLVQQFFTLNDPFKFARDRRATIEVNIDQPVPQTNSTFELHWFEIIKDATGAVVAKTEWKGFATVELHEISIAQMRVNPFGIYIKQLTWQNVAGDAAANGVR